MLENMVSPSSYMEKHTLTHADETLRFHAGKNVILNIENGNPTERDSTRTHSRDISKWDKNAYKVEILASYDKFIAYKTYIEGSGEAVRVLDRENRNRHLIKDFRHPIVDLKWAFHEPYLAVLDSKCNLYVYYLDETENSLSKYIIIINSGAENGSSDDGIGDKPPINRIYWCPYIPEDSNVSVVMLAVSSGKCAEIFMLNKIKSSNLNRTEVILEMAKEVPSAVLNISLESEITSLKISPDATALTVSTVDGFVSSFIIDEAIRLSNKKIDDGIRFANKVRPLQQTELHIEEFFFLDNLCAANQEKFWKYVIISADSGRRIAVYNWENWQCLAKLRFESSSPISRLELMIEKSAKFIFVMEYTYSNLFCIELANLSESPYFLSCTRVSFCNSFISITPCSLNEHSSFNTGGSDLLLDDDDSLSSNSLYATFFALTNKSLLDISVDLERSQMDQSVVGALSSRSQLLAVEPSQSVFALEGLSSNGTSSKRFIPSNNSKTNHDSCANIFTAKVTELFEEKFKELSGQVASLSDELRKLKQENTELKNQQKVCNSLIQEKITFFGTQFSSPNNSTELIVRKLNSELHDQLFQNIRSLLTSNTGNIQRSVESSQAKAIESVVTSGINRFLVPSIDNICTQLYQQLNTTFSVGLTQFLEQFQDSIRATLPTQSDLEIIEGLIESNQIEKAFELALSADDQTNLIIVCSRVDPDNLFVNSVSPLPPSILLKLLQKLCQKLETDTDLKFRYIENILLVLDNSRSLGLGEFPPILDQFRPALEQCSNSLRAFGFSDASAICKRQTRMSDQMIANMLRK